MMAKNQKRFVFLRAQTKKRVFENEPSKKSTPYISAL